MRIFLSYPESQETYQDADHLEDSADVEPIPNQLLVPGLLGNKGGNLLVVVRIQLQIVQEVFMVISINHVCLKWVRV